MARGWELDGFVLRSPLRPIDALDQLARDAGIETLTVASDAAALRNATAQFRRNLSARLRPCATDPVIAEAVYLSSPGAWDALQQQPADERRRAKTDRSFWGYLSRMSHRPTPFGTMAGWTVGRFAATTDLELPPISQWRRATQLDLTLAEDLIRRAALGWSPQTPLRPSPWHYVLAGRIHYLRAESGRLGQMLALEVTEARTAALEKAREQPAAQAVIDHVAAIVGDRDAAARVVADMIDRELLIPEGALLSTTDDPCAAVVAGMRNRPGGERLATDLQTATDAFAAQDAEGLGAASPERLRAIVGPLQAAAGHAAAIDERDTGRRRRVHPAGVRAGLRKPSTTLSLGSRVRRAIFDAIEVLARLHVADGYDRLADFRAEFAERYEHREVPLVEALDPRSGICLDVAPARASLGRWESHILARLQGQLPGEELVLDQTDLDHAPTGRHPIPDTGFFTAWIAAEGEAAIDAGKFELVNPRFSGPPAVKLLGRFCNSDPDVHALTAAQIRREEALDPTSIYAELVTFSSAYPPSLHQRPVLRGYEVEYGGLSGAAPDRRIPIGDLLLSLDHRHQFVLRSAALARRVQIRASSAFNILGLPGPAIPRFLMMLEGEGVRRPLMWTWETLGDASWRPRVRYARNVLSVAAWRLAPGWETGDDADRILALRAWRGRMAVPRFVRLVDETEQRPWFDLENPLCIDVLAGKARTGQALALQEQYPESDREPVHGEGGRYVHDLVIPLTRAVATRGQSQRLRLGVDRTIHPVDAPDCDRLFVPGSQWLTAKLYCHAAAGDDVLHQVVAPLRRELMEAGAVEQFHFLRYRDPRDHLRVRVFASDLDQIAAVVMPALARHAERAIADRQIWRVQLDTYARELERYGGVQATKLTETLWTVDSAAVLAGLEKVRSAERRWLLALVGVHLLLRDFGLDASGRRDLVAVQVSGMHELLATDAIGKAGLAAEVRKRRAEIATAIDAVDDPGQASLAALAARSEVAQRVYAQLRGLSARGQVSAPLDRMLADHIHLHVNRTLRGGTRWDELRIYDLLSRHYAGEAARGPGAGATKTPITRPA